MLFLIMLIGSARPLATERPAMSTLAPDTEARWVSFDLTPGNQIRFGMVVNGVPATAILDTGVSQSVLSEVYAARHGLVAVDNGRASAVGGSVAIGHVAIRSLAIGGLSRTGGGLSVVALPANATGSAQPVDALVGQDLIGTYAIDIDYEHKRFRLLASGRLPFRGIAVPIAPMPAFGLAITDVRLGGIRHRPMLIDTGDGAAITLARQRLMGVPLSDQPLTSTLAYGLGGPVVTDLGFAPAVSIGALNVRDVEVRIEPPNGYSATLGIAGRIGNAVLSRYRVLIDVPAGRAVFAPTSATDKPSDRSTSGIQTAVEGRILRVIHVMRGSPAEVAGWHADDLICSVDGSPIGQGDAQETVSGWSIGAPGRTVTLGMCDGRQRDLTLRRFY